jgi:uncharacterized membrane protein
MDIKNLIITTVLLAISDLLWFSISMQLIYLPTLKSINITESINIYRLIFGGLIAWLLMAIGINYLVLPYVNSIKSAGITGAVLGLVIFGTYNATNYASIAKWNLITFIADTTWGCITCALTSMIMYKFISY